MLRSMVEEPLSSSSGKSSPNPSSCSFFMAIEATFLFEQFGVWASLLLAPSKIASFKVRDLL
ncbi:hypothetical protein GOP47_0019007 [Adiantum capillus-veneris]|uniref:Uncharacterized protein n=1 Tax=Adiantum capillus-veneris TaxID=13818 RepID=A0A9D4Z8P3_ADICA|nr:hypothetical protein GOP47_0019007 [Adiantum capillus-veneris]